MNAQELLNLIEYKHARDVFVAECKNGPTWGVEGHRRLDAWAMKKSYTNPCMYGYEIKVSRNDFTSDKKWVDYLSYCNRFYFVCPWGLIAKDELPEGVGLLWASKTGARLFKKKEANYRPIPPPVSLFIYILYSRARIFPPNTLDELSNEEYWRQWLDSDRKNKILGSRVSEHIKDQFRNLAIKNIDLEAELKQRGIEV